MISAEKLEKGRKSRFSEVYTIQISCEKNKIIGNETIKSSQETGLADLNFVHVIKSILTEHIFPVVVKIHSSFSISIKKELIALNRLKNFQNSVKLICDFSCMDDKHRWKTPIQKQVKFCNNKKDSLHFIVLEYIENGQIEHFFNNNPSNEELCSIFIQIELSIITLALDYRMSHGDLNSGNILFSHTDKKEIRYNILGREYRIPSFGIIPKFIDYGRFIEYREENIESEDIKYDILLIFGILNVHVQNEEIKDKLNKWIFKVSEDNIQNFNDLIHDTKIFFRNI